jgi:hypothetical protein
MTSITLTWYYEDDPDTLHTDTLKHDDRGEDIDGLIWSRDLLEKLRYDDEAGGCREPDKRPGSGGWRVTGNPGGGKKKNTGSTTEKTALSASAASDGDSDCYWVHSNACIWQQYCPPDVIS